MKPGAENRKKTILAGALGMAALVSVYVIYNQLFGGSAPPPPPPPVITNAGTAGGSTSTSAGNGSRTSTTAAAPGVAAVKLASTSASLDPTLDESAMLRTESLVYTGSGRNIFSATYTPPPPPVVKPKFPVRPTVTAPPPLPQQPAGPPPPPPINLKFFGTARRAGGPVQAFLLSGDDVYLAAEGDIVARKYKVGHIGENTVNITDLQYNDSQSLPVQRN